MTARPVARYLARFGGAPSRDPLAHAMGEPLIADTSSEAAEELAGKLEEARQAGLNEGFRAARQEAEHRIMQERQNFAALMAAERARWTEEEASRLHAGFMDAILAVEARLAQSVAAILRPFIARALREQIVEDFVSNVKILLCSDAHRLIRIGGPADLLARLQEKLSTLTSAVEYVPGGSAELTVLSDQTFIESRLAAWMQRLDAAVE
jgi:flagellar biosynthesis/type III secretory pathway protein FliH